MNAPPHVNARFALRPRQLALLLAGVLVSCCGAGCPQFLNEYGPANGRLLSHQPTFAEVASLVNDNSAKLQSLKAKAKISTPGYPSLNSDLIFDRPRRLRLRGEMSFLGPIVDIGSNDDLFWFWIRSNDPDGVYYCRHDQFSRSNARAILPVEPTWLVDALGITTFSSNDQHTEPKMLPDGQLSIESVIQRDGSSTRKITVLDATRGVVLQQHIFDEKGGLVASSTTGGHARDPLSGAIVARDITIHWPAAEFKLHIELSDVVINYLESESPELWTMPQFQTVSAIDLADPRLQVRAPARAPAPAGQPETPGAQPEEESIFKRLFRFIRD